VRFIPEGRGGGKASALLAEALEVAKLTGDLGIDVERVLPLAGAALVAGSAFAAIAGGSINRRSSASMSIGASPRSIWRNAFASSICLTSASRAALLIVAPRSDAGGGRSWSIANAPLPISR
jgi:hypothetical protein